MNGTTRNRRKDPLTARQIKLIRLAYREESDRTEDLAPKMDASDRFICTEFTRIQDRLDVHSRGSVFIVCFKRNLIDFSDIDDEKASDTDHAD